MLFAQHIRFHLVNGFFGLYMYKILSLIKKYIFDKSFVFCYKTRNILYLIDRTCFMFSKPDKENNKYIYSTLSGDKKKYICVFSHYDKDSKVDDYVLFYLKSLFDYGCSINFVTTSDINQKEQEKLFPYCEKIIIRKNEGIDFGSYKCGIDAIKNIEKYEKLIIANDSVYGPLYPIKELIEYGDNAGLDMWGATDSYELNYHVQSYFIVYSKRILTSPYFKIFWKGVRNLKFKWNVIFENEIGGSQFFLKKGFKLASFCDYFRIKQDIIRSKQTGGCNLSDCRYKLLINKNINMTLTIWDVLIKDYRYPFIKRQLLRFNPERVDVSYFQDLLLKHTKFNPDLIENHLKRISASKN